MTAPSYTLPTIGSDNSVADPLVRTALSDLKTLLTDGLGDDNIATGGIGAGSLASDAVTTAKILNSNVTTAKIADSNVTTAKIADANVTTAKIADANVTDAKLASPNNAIYRYLPLTMEHFLNGSVSAGTYVPFHSQAAGATFNTAGSLSPSSIVKSIYFDNDDFTVSAVTQKLRLRFQVVIGNVTGAPTSITAGLYPLSTSGGLYSLGTVVSGSTVAISTFTADTVQQNNSGDFTVPSDGQYCYAIVIVGTSNLTANLQTQLQTRNV